MDVKIFRIFDSVNVRGMRALGRSARYGRSGRCRFFWSLDKIAPRIFTFFGLGRIASGYVDDLGKTHPISFQISTGNSSKVKKSSRNQKLHTSVRGFNLLKASVPKILGMGDFFFKDVTARTLSSISGSLNSSKENRVGSRWPV
jgi:hypothetical protein